MWRVNTYQTTEGIVDVTTSSATLWREEPRPHPLPMRYWYRQIRSAYVHDLGNCTPDVG